MKEGMRSFHVTSPLMKPARVPKASATATATQIDWPWWMIRMAAIDPVSAWIAPIERSISATMRTIVRPAAMIARLDDWMPML